VREVGVKDVPGRPALLATTSQFLDYFGLSKLEELPTLDEIRDLEEQGHQLEAQLQLQARQAMEEDLASDEDVPDAHSEDDVEATFVEDEEVDENNEQIEVVEMHED
jgi:segregation and condensation protein B